MILKPISALLGLSLCLAFWSCKTTQNTSDPTSVDLPQTAVKNQYRGSVCYAYAMMAIVERTALEKTGKTYDLSEEALVYQTIRSQIMTNLDRLRKNQLRGKTLDEKTFYQDGGLLTTDYRYDGSLQILEKNGVVTEDDWTYKLEDDAQNDKLRKAIYASFKKLGDKIGYDKITEEMLDQEVMVGQDKFPSTPPKILKNGKTSLQFLADELLFDTQDWEEIDGKDIEGTRKLIQVAKYALNKKQIAALSFSVDFNLLDDERFTGQPPAARRKSLPTPYKFTIDGGHAVLVTDWVNKGDKPGAMSPADQKKSFEAPIAQLDYFVFKNSWGLQDERTDRLVQNGFYKIDPAYMEKVWENGGGILKLLVPLGDAWLTDPVYYEGHKPFKWDRNPELIPKS